MIPCACPHRDAMSCAVARYPAARAAWRAYLDGEGERPDPCDCACHEADDLDDDDDVVF